MAIGFITVSISSCFSVHHSGISALDKNNVQDVFVGSQHCNPDLAQSCDTESSEDGANPQFQFLFRSLGVAKNTLHFPLVVLNLRFNIQNSRAPPSSQQ